MIDAACRQSSYLLPLLTNTSLVHKNKMKRNTTNDDNNNNNNNNDEVLSTSSMTNRKKILSVRKKLKFGVDAILGMNSDNDSSLDNGNESDDELKHKGNSKVFMREISSVRLVRKRVEQKNSKRLNTNE
jgi:hypothetical protein